MVNQGTAAPTLEQAILDALASGDEARAAMLLRRAFGRDSAAGSDDLPELLEELAEYFASAHRDEDALSTAARAVVASTLQGSGPDALRRRCRIAEMLLRMELPDEACAVYAAVAEEAPGESWVHEAAGSDYADMGDDEFAFAWLTAGVEHAMANDEDPACISRLLALRRMTMDSLELARDDLDHEAAARLRQIPRRALTDDDIGLLIDLDGDAATPERALQLLAFLRRDARSS